MGTSPRDLLLREKEKPHRISGGSRSGDFHGGKTNDTTTFAVGSVLSDAHSVRAQHEVEVHIELPVDGLD